MKTAQQLIAEAKASVAEVTAREVQDRLDAPLSDQRGHALTENLANRLGRLQQSSGAHESVRATSSTR